MSLLPFWTGFMSLSSFFSIQSLLLWGGGITSRCGRIQCCFAQNIAVKAKSVFRLGCCRWRLAMRIMCCSRLAIFVNNLWNTVTAPHTKATPRADGGRLTTANRLHELLEAARLRLGRSRVRLSGCHHGALLLSSLGQILGAVLELGLSRASRCTQIASETPHAAGPLRRGAEAAWPIFPVAHLFDR